MRSDDHLKVAQSQWAQDLGAPVVLPKDGGLTCWSKVTGSLLDFALASSVLVPWLQLERQGNVPWSPHEALRLRISAPPQEQLSRSLVRAQPLPSSVASLERLPRNHTGNELHHLLLRQ